MQHRNYTTTQNDWVLPKTPGGGGFSTTVFSLQYLFEQHTLHKNIWTTDNTNFDLCRYTGCKFIFYRHQWADFIVTYTLMYPMTLSFPDYMQCQPLQMLLQKRKIIIRSLQHKPTGKAYVKKRFRPPKQMTNKWFFQNQFALKPLILIKATVADLTQPFLGPGGGNELVSLQCLNIHNGYITPNWGTTQTQGYAPYSTAHLNQVKWEKGTKSGTATIDTTHYNATSLNQGWFQKTLLQADKIQFTNTASDLKPPTYWARYNPKEDTGVNNSVYLVSINSTEYRKPETDRILIANNKPLWMLLYGFIDYIKHIKKTEVTSIYFLLIQSDHIHPFADTALPKTHLILDSTFINGQGPFNTPVPPRMQGNWYPTLEHQQDSICNIIKAGPFTYKPDPTQGNWELHYTSTFFFKWGGALEPNNQVTDPTLVPDYPSPNTVQPTIQISDPSKQIPESILHSWDFRRGYITRKALKRMQEHLETATFISTDADHQSPRKKPRLQSQMPLLQEEETEDQKCLLSLFEEPTWQEAQEETSVKQLIQQQQQQQQKLKLQLLSLITSIKQKQMQLQLHSGLPQ